QDGSTCYDRAEVDALAALTSPMPIPALATKHPPKKAASNVRDHLEHLAQAAQATGYIRPIIEDYVPAVDLQYLVDNSPVAAIRVRAHPRIGTWRNEFPARLPGAFCTSFTQRFAGLEDEITDQHFSALNYWWRTIPATGVDCPPRPSTWIDRVYDDLR